MKEVIGVMDKIVVNIVDQDRKTAGGLIVPEIAVNEPQQTCIVVSKGKTTTEEINVGDTLYCHPNAGMAIMVDGVIMKILKDDEVYAVVKEK